MFSSDRLVGWILAGLGEAADPGTIAAEAPAPGSAAAADRIAGLVDNAVLLLAANEVRYAEANRHAIWLVTDCGRVKAATRGMDNLERELSSHGFVRVHRSFLVNPVRVRRVVHKGNGLICLDTDADRPECIPAADNLIEGTAGNGDLLINRNFAWSGPVAGIGAVAVARAAFEAALDFAKTYTAGGPSPIINFQYPGYVLGDVAARIDAARTYCYKTAHYMDTHDYHGEAIGAMCKVLCTEMLFDCVFKCMQVVGVNALDKKRPFHRYLREASLLPLYDAGNFGMQRRRVHGVMADPSFDPRAVMNHEFMPFTKEMEGIDTVPGPVR